MASYCTQFLHLEEVISDYCMRNIRAAQLGALDLRCITTPVASQPGKRPNRRVWWCRRSMHRCCASILKSHRLLSLGRHPISRMRTCGGLSSAFVNFHVCTGLLASGQANLHQGQTLSSTSSWLKISGIPLYLGGL